MNTCYIKGTIYRRLLRLMKWSGSISAIFWGTRVPIPIGYPFADNQRREVFRGTLGHVPPCVSKAPCRPGRRARSVEGVGGAFDP